MNMMHRAAVLHAQQVYCMYARRRHRVDLPVIAGTICYYTLDLLFFRVLSGMYCLLYLLGFDLYAVTSLIAYVICPV